MRRREFLRSVPLTALLAPFPLASPRAREALGALAAAPDPAAAAGDEELWGAIARAFPVDRSVVNLNNGGVSPSPRVVQEALARHLAFANELPPEHMWRLQEPRRETVRAGLAEIFGCDPEEVAITRNASEGLETLQLGIDLAPGDEVLTSTQDYPRMIATFRQRERREGIRLVEVALPAPVEDPAEIARRFAAGISERTRLILVSHVVFETGAILPVRDVVRLGRERGIPVIVDGAHAFGHFPFTRDELECDFYATSLHKWLHSAVGTGMLYVRRERIEEVWPLMASPDTLAGDIRKFEEIGTHPCGLRLAIAEAIAFHRELGAERKAARLRWLRDRWARRLAEHERVRLWTSLAPGASCAIATFSIDGIDPADLHRFLWRGHQVLTTPIRHEGLDERDRFSGLRVSPSVYTLAEEVDRFADLVEHVLRHGLPA